MKKLKVWSMMMLMAMMLPLITSCGDDSVSSLDSYIVGQWHTFRYVIQTAQQSGESEVSKTGKLSEVYMELTFKNDGTVTSSYWKQNSQGVSSWVTETATYTVSGNTVKIIEPDGTAELYFDGGQKVLYLRAFKQDQNYGNVSIYLYFKK